MTNKTWDGSNAAYASAPDWSPTGVPTSGDNATITSGTVTVAGADLAANLTLNVGAIGAATPTLILRNTTIQVSDIVQLGMPDQSGSPSSPTLTEFTFADGDVTNAGRLDVSRGTLAINGTFTNAGTLELQPYATIRLASAADTFVNNGTLTTFKPFEYQTSSNGYTTGLYLGVPITGTGVIVVYNGFNLELGSSVGAGQTVTFGRMISYNETQQNNVLTIDDLTTFKATIVGWGSYQPIVATGPAYDSVQTALTNNATTLSFLRGDTVVSALTFTGRYSTAQFSLSAITTSDGREQTMINYNAAAAMPAGPLNVSRYFSKTTGTQFLTASASEAANVGTSRPDLAYEGVGFDAVNPADNDPLAAPVYRFFDQIDGTHFFTASASERDTIIATRSDLTYEPNSTFYEHATAQAGDQAVYRFFESTNGTHFYTASLPEQASILANRPDLIAEGIAFYAPTG